MQSGEAPHNPVPRTASNLNKIIGMRINLHERACGDRKEMSDPSVLNGITIEFSVDECEDKALGIPSRNRHEPLGLAIKPSSLQRKANSQNTSPSPTSLIKESPPSNTRKASRNASRKGESARLPKSRTLMSDNDQGGNPPGMRRAFTSTSPSTMPNSSCAPLVSSSNVEALHSPPGTRHHHTSTHNQVSKPSSYAFVETGSNDKHFISQGTGVTHVADDRAASDADRARRRMERSLLQEKKRLHEERRNATLNQLRRTQQSSSFLEQSSSNRSLDVSDLKVPRPVGGRSGCVHSHSGSGITSILKQGRFSLADSSSSFKQQRQEDSQASLSSSRVRFQADESLSLLANSALMFSESCTSFTYEASRRPADHRQQGNSHTMNESDDHNGSPRQHGRGTIKADSRMGGPEGNKARESRPGSPTLGGSPVKFSSETPGLGLPPPLMSAGRQLTPQGHHQLTCRHEELQQQRKARQQLQQQEKTSRRGLFGRKTKPEPIEPTPMTDHQRRMAAAQAAFAMIGSDHG